MKISEIVKKVKKIGYLPGVKKRHATIWNCPCPDMAHPIGIGDHWNEECRYLNSILHDLGPHKKAFKN